MIIALIYQQVHAGIYEVSSWVIQVRSAHGYRSQRTKFTYTDSF